MADDLIIRFGGDLSGLNSAIEAARSSIAKLKSDIGSGLSGGGSDDGAAAKQAKAVEELGKKAEVAAKKVKELSTASSAVDFRSLQEGINTFHRLDESILSARNSAKVFQQSIATQGSTAAEFKAIGESVKTLSGSQFGALINNLLLTDKGFKSAAESASIFGSAISSGESVKTLSGSQFGALINNLLLTDKGFKSAAESAKVFEQTVATGDAVKTLSGSQFGALVNSLLLVDKGFKSAAASASVFEQQLVGPIEVPVNPKLIRERASEEWRASLMADIESARDEVQREMSGRGAGSLGKPSADDFSNARVATDELKKQAAAQKIVIDGLREYALAERAAAQEAVRAAQIRGDEESKAIAKVMSARAQAAQTQVAAEVQTLREIRNLREQQIEIARNELVPTERHGAPGYLMTNMSFQLNDIATMAMMGFSPTSIISSQAGQIFQLFQMAGEGNPMSGAARFGESLLGLISPLTIGLTAAAAAATAVAIALYDMHQKSEAAIRSVAEIAGAGNAKNFQDITGAGRSAIKSGTENKTWWDALGWGSSLSTADTEKLVKSVGSIKEVADPTLDVAVKLGRALKEAFGSDQASAKLEELAGYFENSSESIKKLVEHTRDLSQEEKENAKDIAENGTEHEKQAKIIELVAEQIRKMRSATELARFEQKSNSEAMKQAVEVEKQKLASGQRLGEIEYLLDLKLGEISESYKKVTREINSANDGFLAQAAALRAIPESLDTIIDKADKLASGMNTLPDKLKKVADQFKILGTSSSEGFSAIAAGRSDTSGDAELIRKIAARVGIDPNVAVAVARSEGLGKAWAGGDGGSSFGPLQAHFGGMNPAMPHKGQGDAMRAAGIDATNPENKEAVLEWQLQYAKKHGWGEWYGAAKAGIGRFEGLGKMDGETDEQFDRRSAASQRLLENQKALNEAKNGGSQIDLAELAIAERAAQGKASALNDAKERVAAARSELQAQEAILATGKDTGEVAKDVAAARKKLAEASKQEREAEFASRRADADLAIAGAKTPADRRAGQLKKLDLDTEEFGQDAARRTQIEAQKTSILREGEIERRQITMESAARDTQIELQALQIKQSIALRDAQLRGASSLEQYQITQQFAEKRLQIERELQAKDAALWEQGTAQYRQAQNRLLQIDAQISEQRSNMQKTTLQTLQSEYQSAFQQIGGTISSSIVGMAQGTLRLRDAFRNVLSQILSMFVQAGVKMAMNWAASLATQAAMTISSETAKTAAVATGTAARTGLEASASAAQVATIIPNVLKSIFASAAETFAGVFGFMAPIMGPAAAGPAGAAEAAVLGAAAALPSFAVGSWNLPNDMVAKVHKGEMIVPANAASAWRSALDGGPSNAGGVNVHHSTNINISAIDASGVKKWFNDNSHLVIGAVNEGVRKGAHLGRSQLMRG